MRTQRTGPLLLPVRLGGRDMAAMSSRRRDRRGRFAPETPKSAVNPDALAVVDLSKGAAALDYPAGDADVPDGDGIYGDTCWWCLTCDEALCDHGPDHWCKIRRCTAHGTPAATA